MCVLIQEREGLAHTSIVKSLFYQHIRLKEKGGPGAMVRAVTLSHQVVVLKQPLRRFCKEKAC